MFWNKLNWTAYICNGIKPHLDHGVAEILVYHKGSSDNRRSIFKCRFCNEMAVVKYSPWELKSNEAEVHTRILQVFDFLKLERPTGEKHARPALMTANLSKTFKLT